MNARAPDPAQPSAPPPTREELARPTPTFLQALRGVWLFTWRSQLTWKQAPVLVIALLVMPCLIYVTTSSPEAWTKRHAVFSDPGQLVDQFSARLARQDLELKPEQRTQLAQIYTEEFAAATDILNEADFTSAGIERRTGVIQGCYDKIRVRARDVLTERQADRFQYFQNRTLRMSLAEAGEPQWSWTGPFYHWLVDFYFLAILPLMCVRTCGALIRDELQADTLSYLTTRPVSRARLLIVKYLSQTAWLQIVVLVQALLLFGAGGLRHIPELGPLFPLYLAAQFLAVLAWSALGTLFGLLTRRPMAVAIVYGLIVEIGIGSIPTNINALSLMRHLKALLAHNEALLGVFNYPIKGTLGSVEALLLASVVFLGLAAFLFSFREYHHTTEMQK
jgi:hypothetical protein